jgi:fucose 4-O-acetylase-like acetyltransferase
MDLFNKKSILQKKRWPWVDYDKGISILLVGYGHCIGSLNGYGIDLSSYPFLNYINVFLYGFRMPLFFIISGMLVKRSLAKKGLKEYLVNRSNNILYPLLVWGFLQISLLIYLYGFTNLTHKEFIDTKSYLYLIISPNRLGHFWYLNALFFIGAIYAALKAKCNFKTSIQLVIGCILYFLNYYCREQEYPLGFLSNVFEYYLFFGLGDLISDTLLDETKRKKYTSIYIMFPLLILFLITQYYLTSLNLGSSEFGMYYVERKLPHLYLVAALIGCSFSMSISFLLQKYQKFVVIRIIGYYSLYIYCMQIILILFGRILFYDLIKIQYPPLLVILVWMSGVIVPIFIYNYLMKIKFWQLFTFKKPIQ